MKLEVVDAADFERLMEGVTGSAAEASGWSARLKARNERIKTPITLEEAQAFFGGLWPILRRFTTLDPLIDVNAASEELLGIVVSAPAFKVGDPARRLQDLLAARKAAALGDEQLRILLGVPKEGEIWRILGTRSRFWRLAYGSAGGTKVVLDFRCRYPGEDGGPFEVLAERQGHGD